ncbi:uncharacterized protein [Physcomitrium patens]|nr:uncharacterized protein LOC112273128 isoform X2 [Physcomitrium patens]XP_024357330.1 uncharacterized protein LOC112273128 isoform X2 [Physcomitrium patens]XP_024357331.1 uncharacterized protein LOC112273128 isoform X2 [Physcomitrium patens]XP_024357332.1 uncharacterized protein LOC112273128 isoform X2 [Physcomitrium patens]XP_024357334.1 uncharacterized protein LOC112273128 isoform X2 [Physcomitrium patens]XP_024357335.1 uncharacterized protein LOC112273128 isoform X2 [Physcomitrium patens]|eukprot:XP_024357329.1 uncharacterized protein LOC112273128 isoform X2 [Physcomitrella patens]
MDGLNDNVSSYLKNPLPVFYSSLPSHDETDQKVEKSFRADQVAKIRAAVAELLVFGFSGTSMNHHARRLITMGAGGVILFNRNFKDPEQVARLCADLKREAGNRPLLIMVDQEGGYVQRFGPPFTVIPHARIVGDTSDPEAAGAIASVIAKELRAVNVDMNLAPVLDVDTNPENTVIGKRSFATTPARVANLGFAYIRGLQCEGVAACAKHYPGHGDTTLDSHVDLPLLPHSLTRLVEIEMSPFAKAVDADVAAVMVAHIDVPCFSGRTESARKPATMCVDTIAYLRDALLFEGVIISDCMETGAIVKEHRIEEAAVQAVLAGIDMVLVSHTLSRQIAVVDALVQAVLTERIPYRRVMDAVSRIFTLKQTYVRSSFQDWIEKGLREFEIQQIGCKEHHDIVANIVYQSAAIRGEATTIPRRKRR